jgi:glycosyltransferase involved in cell wall biosynthesis
MRTGRYDAVLAYLRTPSFYSELANTFLANKVRLVVSERSIVGEGGVKEWCHLLMHLKSDKIVLNAFHQHDAICRKYKWLTNRTVVIRNAVGDAFLRSPVFRSVDGDVCRLIAIGRVSKEKNPIRLALALLMCSETFGLRVEVDWAGRWDLPPHDPYGRRLEAVLERLRGSGVVWRWLGERSDIVDLLQSHDALVHSAIYEGQPNAVCEALAAGRPVLAGRVGDNGRLVEEGVSGLLFEPTNEIDIALTIRRFIALSSEAKRRMGEAGRRYALKTMTLDQMASQYEEVLFA